MKRLGIALAWNATQRKKRKLRMKWLKNLLKKFKKNQKPNGYPTQADVNKMVADYNAFLDNIKRDEKGRWIFPDNQVVKTPARFKAIIDSKWIEAKGTLTNQCGCNNGEGCKCKKI
jgi:hypothetical protein